MSHTLSICMSVHVLKCNTDEHRSCPRISVMHSTGTHTPHSHSWPSSSAFLAVLIRCRYAFTSASPACTAIWHSEVSDSQLMLSTPGNNNYQIITQFWFPEKCSDKIGTMAAFQCLSRGYVALIITRSFYFLYLTHGFEVKRRNTVSFRDPIVRGSSCIPPCSLSSWHLLSLSNTEICKSN
jgi:hypothetical protein